MYKIYGLCMGLTVIKLLLFMKIAVTGEKKFIMLQM